MHVEEVDLKNEQHKNAVVKLMHHYMSDPMGGGTGMPEGLPEKMLKGLELQPNYVGFVVVEEKQYVALANCFVNYSTFKAKQLINIHDFVVSPMFRKKGLGEYLLNEIAGYARKANMCRVTLEVREDNINAMGLYKKIGFEPCKPNMYFWEKHL